VSNKMWRGLGPATRVTDRACIANRKYICTYPTFVHGHELSFFELALI